jgi:centriolar protein POC1
VPAQRFVHALTGHLNWVRTCQVSPDGRLAASGSDDKTVKIWDLQSKRCIRTYDDHGGMINSVAFHPDGTCVATGSSDHSIKVRRSSQPCSISGSRCSTTP